MSFPEHDYRAPYVPGPTSPAPTSAAPLYVSSGPQQYTQQFPPYGPPSGGFPLPPPKKKRRTGLIVAWSIFGVLFLVAFIGVVGAIAASTNKKPTAATQTTAAPAVVQHCDHGHLADGSCAGGNEPVAQNAAYLEVVRPLIPGVTDEKLTELGTAMCDALDRNGGDVAQLVNVDSTMPKPTLLQVIQAAGRYLCPQWMTNTQQYTLPAAPAKPAGTTIDDGTWTVGEDVPAGTYKTTGSGSDCYWSITKSGSNGDDIINNHIGGGNLRVTLKKGQDFETDRCGTWTKIK